MLTTHHEIKSQDTALSPFEVMYKQLKEILSVHEISTSHYKNFFSYMVSCFVPKDQYPHNYNNGCSHLDSNGESQAQLNLLDESIANDFIAALNKTFPELNATLKINANEILKYPLVVIDAIKMQTYLLPWITAHLKENPSIVKKILVGYNYRNFYSKITSAYAEAGISLNKTDSLEDIFCLILNKKIPPIECPSLPKPIKAIISNYIELKSTVNSFEHRSDRYIMYLSLSLPTYDAQWIMDYFNNLIPKSAEMKEVAPGAPNVKKGTLTTLSIHTVSLFRNQFREDFANAFKSQSLAKMEEYQKQSNTIKFSTEECITQLELSIESVTRFFNNSSLSEDQQTATEQLDQALKELRQRLIDSTKPLSAPVPTPPKVFHGLAAALKGLSFELVGADMKVSYKKEIEDIQSRQAELKKKLGSAIILCRYENEVEKKLDELMTHINALRLRKGFVNNKAVTSVTSSPEIKGFVA